MNPVRDYFSAPRLPIGEVNLYPLSPSNAREYDFSKIFSDESLKETLIRVNL